MISQTKHCTDGEEGERGGGGEGGEAKRFLMKLIILMKLHDHLFTHIWGQSFADFEGQ